MDANRTSWRSRHVLWSAAILAAGLLLAAGLYWRAVEAELAAQASLGQGLSTTGLSPEYSKKFLHDLQLYGGKANVLIYQLRAWLAEVFSGKSLAYLVAAASLAVSLAVFWLGGGAGPAPSDGQEEAPGP